MINCRRPLIKHVSSVLTIESPHLNSLFSTNQECPFAEIVFTLDEWSASEACNAPFWCTGPGPKGGESERENYAHVLNS